MVAETKRRAIESVVRGLDQRGIVDELMRYDLYVDEDLFEAEGEKGEMSGMSLIPLLLLSFCRMTACRYLGGIGARLGSQIVSSCL